MESKPLINRVANSKIKVVNLEDYFPKQEVLHFDLKDYLFMELVLKEKDFRTAIKELDWEVYRSRSVAVFCSTDAILPTWAFMLVISALQKVEAVAISTNPANFINMYYARILASQDWSIYEEARVVIKGCGDKTVPVFAYSELTRLLQPYAQSVMFGEPCSTVPVFKRPRKLK